MQTNKSKSSSRCSESTVEAAAEWRCTACNSLLGSGTRGRMYLSVGTGQYAVTLPVEAVCRRCATYNATTFVVSR